MVQIVASLNASLRVRWPRMRLTPAVDIDDHAPMEQTNEHCDGRHFVSSMQRRSRWRAPALHAPNPSLQRVYAGRFEWRTNVVDVPESARPDLLAFGMTAQPFL